MRKSSRIVIVGSLNIDYVAAVERLPAAGQTVSATGLIQRFGGKGANQAIAAARQGAAVSMIGCVGSDGHGAAYRKRLLAEGINAAGLITCRHALTGTALIAVESRGENLIIVAPGANGQLRPAMVRAHAGLIEAAELVLLQFEIPMPALLEAVRLANRAEVPVLLNPSPWCVGFPWEANCVDTVIANVLEARALFGSRAVDGAALGVLSIQRALKRKNISRVIITRGARPTVCISAEEHFEIPALPVNPVDTVGAGDAFAGAYAAARAEGADLRRAIRLASCAGALATLKRGAQESTPTRAATARAAAGL